MHSVISAIMIDMKANPEVVMEPVTGINCCDVVGRRRRWGEDEGGTGDLVGFSGSMIMTLRMEVGLTSFDHPRSLGSDSGTDGSDCR